MDQQQGIVWPESGPSSAPMNPAAFPSVLQPTAGPSSVNLNSPQFAVPQLPPSASAPGYADPNVPDPSGRGRGRGRGRGLRGVGRGRGRGRGARGGMAGTGSVRQSGRMTTRAAADGGTSKLKLSLKMNASGAGESYGGRMTSFLGEYDRELDDNPEEPLEFEEQFIMRVPKEVADGKKGEGGLREMIKGKGLEGLEMKFMDSRRAAVKINGTTYSSKLVDLPCIIESQKTHDSRHLFKVADISQMLVLGPQVASEVNIPSGALNQDDYIWPHGLTPPLRHVRKRRFRKRLSRRMIEVVEEHVEELLRRDREADSSTYELLDAPDPDRPDSFYENYDPNAPHQFDREASEYSYGDPGSVMPSEAQWGEGEGEEGDEDAEGEEDEFDQELADALMEQMGGGSGESEDEDGFDEGDADDADEAGEDEDEDEDEDDEETIEKKAKIRQFASEIKQLEAAIDKKRAGFQGGNPIMIKRFEETIAGMQNDINTKAVNRQVLVDELERAKPGVPSPAAEHITGGDTPVGAGVESDADDDLFGEADEGGVDTQPQSTQDTPGAGSLEAEGDEDAGSGMEQDADAEGEGEEGTDIGTDAEAEGEDEEGDDEEEEEEEEGDENDELAAMLEAELGPSGPTETQDQTDALEAIDSMELQDDIDYLAGGDIVLPTSPAPEFALDFSTREGGVGQRRLVEGAEEGDSGSSDDSDD